MNEQPLNLRASLREIWRRRLLLTAIAVFCGLGGLVIGILRPVDPTAATLVLLPTSVASNSSTPTNDTHTDAVIARSTPVLAAAGAEVSPPLGATALRNLVTVKSLSGQILQIEARASQDRYAEQLSNAVATSYINYVGQLESTSAGPGVAALQQESDLFTQQIKDLQTQIDTVSARITSEGAATSVGQQDVALLRSLQTEQSQISLQLNNVTGQIAATQLANGSVVSATRILQKATIEPSSKVRFVITAGVIGFAAGLLGGAVFVLVRLQRGPRMRLRDEIARSAGAPVIASLDTPRCGSPSAWRRLLGDRPRASDEWALRHVLDSVLQERRHRQIVRVISFAGDTAALATGPRLALFAASFGMPTALILRDPIMHDDRSLKPLRACFAGTEPPGHGLPFTVGLDDLTDPPPQLLISVAIFNGESAARAPNGTMTLLSVSPDFATADDLARLALHTADCQSALDGVVVVNPDPTDATNGLIADDTHRLLPAAARVDRDDTDLVRLRTGTGAVRSSSDRLATPDR